LQEFPLAELEAFLHVIKKTYDYRFSQAFILKEKQYGQLTLFNKKKLQLLDGKTITLGPSIWERTKKRGERSSLITRFKYGEKEFLLANTHLICRALNNYRLIQLEKIIAYLKKTSDASLPVLLVGDLNYSSLVRQKKLLQFMERHDFINAYKTNTFKVLFFRYQLDYVFYKNCNITDISVSPLQYSDHFPIEFNLSL
jgi:endonuclease/exonuclease/phosphatase family metal-dependent hydrolase